MSPSERQPIVRLDIGHFSNPLAESNIYNFLWFLRSLSTIFFRRARKLVYAWVFFENERKKRTKRFSKKKITVITILIQND